MPQGTPNRIFSHHARVTVRTLIAILSRAARRKIGSGAERYIKWCARNPGFPDGCRKVDGEKRSRQPLSTLQENNELGNSK